MAFTAISDRDVIIADNTGICNYIASGTILRGQAVEVVEDTYVIATDSKPSRGFVGVAIDSKTAGYPIGVWNPGNIVWGRASGTGVAAGDRVVATVNGEFQDEIGGSGAIGLSLTTQATADGLIKVLLY